MWFIGRKIIPSRDGQDEHTKLHGLNGYLAEVKIVEKSQLAGKKLSEARLSEEYDLTILNVIRGKSVLEARGNLVLREGDKLLVEGERESVLKIKDAQGIELSEDTKSLEADSEALSLAEVVVLRGSTLVGKTLKSVELRNRHQVQVLAINRGGTTLREKLGNIRFQLGDVLLLQGEVQSIKAIEEMGMANILNSVEGERLNRSKAPIAIGVFILAITLASAGFLSFSVAALSGAVLLFLFRCVTTEDAYRGIDWSVLLLIGGMLALGVAMEKTGTEKYLASLIVEGFGQFGPLVILSGFFWLTIILTQPMSNQAAAAVVLPVAIHTAMQLGLNPRTFSMMVAVAASCSYLTPLEPACLMVYGPGKYRFSDFIKVGAPLTFVIYIVAAFLVPIVWKL